MKSFKELSTAGKILTAHNFYTVRHKYSTIVRYNIYIIDINSFVKNITEYMSRKIYKK